MYVAYGSARLEWFTTKPLGQIVNRFNTDLNMSECVIHWAYPVDMILPNHAVNVMYDAMIVLGSAILVTVAGPYVST